MAFPEDYARAPGITLYDPLAELLGAADAGRIDYTFADAVRLAGHACPTVAGAWLLTIHALRALYGEATPVRGKIRIDVADALPTGVAGVMGSIMTLLTGAAGEGGFKGLGGRYARCNLLRFGVDGQSGFRFTRLDTLAAVDGHLHLDLLPADPRVGPLLVAILDERALPEEKALFRTLWQQRVSRILLDPGTRVVELEPVSA